MATIHRTTLTPSKLELLTGWLPKQPWYRHAGRPPMLAKAGGFRLDDPDGEVGIEFMIVADTAGDGAVVYHVPLTYRSAALPGEDLGLIGTAEHGVLGTRYVYDGAYDSILLTQLVELVQGRAKPQAQSLSDTPDPTVHSRPVLAGAALTVTGRTIAGDGPDGTRARISAVDAAGAQADLMVRLIRIPDSGRAAVPDDAGHVDVAWQQPDGTEPRGVVVSVTRVDG
jgi:hypothetical protein